jgi:hypothetical protein
MLARAWNHHRVGGTSLALAGALAVSVALGACGGGGGCPAGSVAVADRCVAADASAPADLGDGGLPEDASPPPDADAPADAAPDDAAPADAGEVDLGAPDLGVDACVAVDETCNRRDDDCDGDIDEGLPPVTSYADVDADGFGDDATAATGCDVPMGRARAGGDCDDRRALTNPDGAEACNGLDDDCDGSTDEGVTTPYFRDADGDGRGSPSSVMASCEAPPGFVANDLDCDDMAADVYTGATELCNGRDDDCDLMPDETFACVGGSTQSCATSCGSTGVNACTATCALPPASACMPPAEVCNRFDEDCDGLIDETSALAWGTSTDLAQPGATRVQIVGNGSVFAALTVTAAAGVVVRALDATMTPTGSAISIVATSYPAAITLSGADVVVAYATGGEVYAKRAPLATLAFPATATLIVDPPGILSAVDVAASGDRLLFAYASGQDVYGVRTSTALVADTANTLLVDGNDLGFRVFDLSAAPAGGWAVAYSEDLASETDREVFLQAIAASGTALDGAPFRTANAVDDAYPALAFDAASGLFALAWLETTTARLQTFRLSGSGAARAMSAERVTPETIATFPAAPTVTGATPLAVDVAAGAVTVVYAATSVESSRYTLAPLARQGTGRVVSAFAGIDSVGVTTPIETVGGRPRLPPARAILNRDLSTLSLVLGCP